MSHLVCVATFIDILEDLKTLSQKTLVYLRDKLAKNVWKNIFSSCTLRKKVEMSRIKSKYNVEKKVDILRTRTRLHLRNAVQDELVKFYLQT